MTAFFTKTELLRIKSFLLLALIFSFGVGAILLLWGSIGFVFFTIGFLSLFLLVSQTPAPMMMRLMGARKLRPMDLPKLHYINSELSFRAALDATPSLYYLPSRQMNAFALGRGQAACIAITDGLLKNLSTNEMEGVLAHEMAHIKNEDGALMNLVGLFIQVTELLINLGMLLYLFLLPFLLLHGQEPMGLVLLLFIGLVPFLTKLLWLNISRNRECEADLFAFQLTGKGESFISALEKIDNSQNRWKWFGHSKINSMWSKLLMTHPLIEERIANLRGENNVEVVYAEPENREEVKEPFSRYARMKKPGVSTYRIIYWRW